MGELSRLAQKMSPFLRIPDDSEVLVVYKSYKMVEDPFNPGREKIRYLVELEGEEKWFDSASTRVMMSFDTCKEGEAVIIRKVMVNGRAKYFIVSPELRAKGGSKSEEKEKDINPKDIPC